MTECAGCGDCCERLPLNTPERADIWGRRRLADPHCVGANRKQAAWMANLTPVSGPYWVTTKDGSRELRWTYDCPNLDPDTRRCLDYANRPRVCSGYPHYGRNDLTYQALPPRCSFIADDPNVRLLPIVAVR